MKSKEFMNIWLWKALEQAKEFVCRVETLPNFVFSGILTKQNKDGDYIITVLYSFEED